MFFDKFNYDQEENELDFFVYNVSTSILNSIRKALMSEYKIHALDEINFISNTSVIHNDFLEHRLHMLPLKTDEYCEFELCITNHSNEIMNIYSDSLIIKRGICDFKKDVLLLKLRPSEGVDLIAKTSYDCGKTNIKYRPTSISYFKINKLIKISPELLHKKDIIKKYFQDNYNLIEQTLLDDELIIGYTSSIRSGTNLISNICNQLKIDTNQLIIEDFYFNNIPTYTFFIESYNLDPQLLIKNTINLLLEKLDEFMNNEIELEIFELKGNRHIDFYIQNERGLIGDILSNILSKNVNIKFCNFYHEHPLNDYILIKIILKEKDDDKYLQYFKNGYLELIEIYKQLNQNI